MGDEARRGREGDLPRPRGAGGDLAGVDCAVCADDERTIPAIETLRVALGERSATVDLCAAHARLVHAAVEPALAAGARRARRRPSSTSVPRLRDGEDREVIRAWARSAGLPVSSAGTISQLVLERYRVEHGLPEGTTVVLP